MLSIYAGLGLAAAIPLALDRLALDGRTTFTGNGDVLGTVSEARNSVRSQLVLLDSASQSRLLIGRARVEDSDPTTRRFECRMAP